MRSSGLIERYLFYSGYPVAIEVEWKGKITFTSLYEEEMKK